MILNASTKPYSIIKNSVWGLEVYVQVTFHSLSGGFFLEIISTFVSLYSWFNSVCINTVLFYVSSVMFASFMGSFPLYTQSNLKAVLKSRNYLLFIISAPAPAPAPAIYCHLKLYYMYCSIVP